MEADEKSFGNAGKNCFEVPDNYFGNLSEVIKGQCQTIKNNPSNHLTPFFSRKKIIAISSVAASIIIFITFMFTDFDSQNFDIDDVISGYESGYVSFSDEEMLEMLVAENYDISSISNDDFGINENYILNSMEYYDILEIENIEQ